jgi:hypothetical protein
MSVSFAQTAPLSQAAAVSSLSLPSQSLLRKHLQSRLQAEINGETGKDNPGLIKVSKTAMWLYSMRNYVDSYPLLYTTLALAHPN